MTGTGVRPAAGAAMAAERAEQPAVFARILADGWTAIQCVAGTVAKRRPRAVYFLARGSSENAAVYARYRAELRLSVPAGLLSPAATTVYDATPNFDGCLVIAVSQSGSSPDLIASLERARTTAVATIAVTNDASSDLARAAELHLDLLAGPERAVTATKSYTAELLTLFCLIEALAGVAHLSLPRLPDLAERMLQRDDEVDALARRFAKAASCITVGRGYNLSTARETALKLMETAYIPTLAFSAADLLHGPIAAVEPGTPAIAVVPNGPGGAAMGEALERLREAHADLIVVGDRAAVQSAGSGTASPDIPEELSPLLLILPLQALAWRLSLMRGHDPDAPRGLLKATQTW